MGASTWFYFTPWQSDPESALQTLRHLVFERGEYQIGGGFNDEIIRGVEASYKEPPFDWFAGSGYQLTPEDKAQLQRAIDTGILKGLNADFRKFVRRVRFARKSIEDLRHQVKALRQPKRKPRSIAALLEQVAESGTHSVLDIESTSAERGFGIANPLSRDEIRRYFGTDSPTHAQAEARWDAVGERLDRWECRFLPIYECGEPREWMFIGCSGD